MTEATSASPPASTAIDTVWVWQCNDTGELEKCLIPATWVQPAWLPALQHRYAAGDRVLYRMHDDGPALPGTIVQDQGMYVAIDGDAPHTYATVHKTAVEPLAEFDQQLDPDSTSVILPPAVSPHTVPDLRRRSKELTARWTLGPAGASWRRQASLRITYVAGRYFQAVLSNVDERDDQGLRQERAAGGEAPLAVHHVPAPRFSQQRLKDTYREALEVVRRHFDADDPDVVAYFRPGPPA
jgi:hypothetical protein